MSKRRKQKHEGNASRRPLSRLWRDRRGAFAMQFALMVVPLVVCTGLAIDGGRSFLARYELESSLDAAALAVGSSTGTTAQLNTLAQKYVTTNFKAPDTTPVAITLDTSVTDEVTIHGTTTLSTYFMPLMGISTVTISADSQVKRGGSNIEVGLMLDVTGSMAGTRIAALKTAANNMIDTVVNDSQTPWFSKIAIVPWANYVNVGSTYATTFRGGFNGTSITAAAWRSFGPQTISGLTWKKGGPFNVSSATWADTTKKYTVKSSNGIIRQTSGGTANRVMVTTSTTLGLAASDYISFQGVNGGFTALNGTIYRVADVSGNTFYLKDATNTSYITYTTATTAATAGTVAKCQLSPNCPWMITTSAAHGLVAGDYAYINGVGTGIDTSAIAPIQVASAPTTTTFYVPNTTPATNTALAVPVATGTVTECFTSACEYQVTTSGSHTYAAGDRIYIPTTGLTWGTGTAPAVTNTIGTTWAIASPGTNTFILPGLNGPSYTANYTANSGTVSVCYTSTCEIQITSASHGLALNDRLYITGAGGMSINTSGNNYWTATNVTTNTFTLQNTLGPNYSSWTSGGTVFCLKERCPYFGFTAANNTYQIAAISTCVTERVGPNAYTDVAPSTTLLGADYPAYEVCPNGNIVQPLTANKTTLHSQINNLIVGGSTAGELGMAWGWYMLSPNFASIWPAQENKALAYGTQHLSKVMVLMTDGDFNLSHCTSVVSNDWADGAPSTQRTLCNATNGSPYTQAGNFCDAMKAQKIIVYTVGFGVTAGSTPDNFLKSCATDVGHYYLAATGNDLQAAFASIATSISKLRVAH